MTEVKEMTADKAHVVADVMSIMYGTLTILANIRECALKGRYYYQTTNDTYFFVLGKKLSECNATLCTFRSEKSA